MKKLTILCDADDTIENLLVHWIAALNKEYCLSVDITDIKSWNVAEAFPTLTSEQIYKPIYTKDFWHNITPIKDSGYYMKKLIEDGHKVYIVSAANFETSDVKVARLLELFPFMDWTKIILAYDKQMIYGDVLIDDGVHNLENSRCMRFLYDQNHNSMIDEKKYNAIRVYSWKDIYEKISKLASNSSNDTGEEALKNVMWKVGITNNPVTRYISDAVAEKLVRENI